MNASRETASPRRHAPASWLRPVADALDAAAAPVPLFIRDDDAGWGDARLLALLDLLAARGLPVDLAVIPCELDAGLARELVAREDVGLHQHGYAHVNHERDGRKCEFGPSRADTAQLADIEAGRARLADLLGDRVDPIFTPPWNRCTADTGHAVLAAGLRVLSREARAAPLGIAGLAELPVHVDWFAHRHGTRLAPDELGARLGAAIAAGGPVGLMLHHALMDDGELRRADELLRLLAGHEAARPARMIELASVVRL